MWITSSALYELYLEGNYFSKDLFFPSLLRVYFERVVVGGLDIDSGIRENITDYI